MRSNDVRAHSPLPSPLLRALSRSSNGTHGASAGPPPGLRRPSTTCEGASATVRARLENVRRVLPPGRKRKEVFLSCPTGGQLDERWPQCRCHAHHAPCCLGLASARRHPQHAGAVVQVANRQPHRLAWSNASKKHRDDRDRERISLSQRQTNRNRSGVWLSAAGGYANWIA
jgi:hypothetical protein